jgi:hypothetical protein
VLSLPSPGAPLAPERREPFLLHMQRICSKPAERRISTHPVSLAAVPRFHSFKYLKSRHFFY